MKNRRGFCRAILVVRRYRSQISTETTESEVSEGKVRLVLELAVEKGSQLMMLRNISDLEKCNS